MRDASGNILATYYKDANNPVHLDEVNLFGSSRIGMAQANTSGTINKYVYELTDHLGNVRSTIFKDASNALVIESYADYYPFGMVIPTRNQPASKAYRFGYQGQFAEKDAETGLDHFEARDYDKRLGRWLCPDPAGQYHSPYLGMGNNPVSGVDPDGMYDTKFGAWVANLFHGGNGIGGSNGNYFYNKGYETLDGVVGVSAIYSGGLNKYLTTFGNNLGNGFHENVMQNWNFMLDHPLDAAGNFSSNLLNSASSLAFTETYINMYKGTVNYLNAPAETKALIDAQAINGMVEGAATMAPLAAISVPVALLSTAVEGGFIGQSIVKVNGEVHRFAIERHYMSPKKGSGLGGAQSVWHVNYGKNGHFMLNPKNWTKFH